MMFILYPAFIRQSLEKRQKNEYRAYPIIYYYFIYLDEKIKYTRNINFQVECNQASVDRLTTIR